VKRRSADWLPNLAGKRFVANFLDARALGRMREARRTVAGGGQGGRTYLPAGGSIRQETVPALSADRVGPGSLGFGAAGFDPWLALLERGATE
jgi:hypothetical protein